MYINGIGLATPAGGFFDACAASYAGLNRFGGHSSLGNCMAGDDESTPLTVSAMPAYINQYEGHARVFKLLECALDDFCANLNSSMDNILQPDQTAILMALPDPADRLLDDDAEAEPRDVRLQSYIDRISQKVLSGKYAFLQQCSLQCVFGERQAFARVMDKASELIAGGHVAHCLVLTVDSLIHLEYLIFLKDENCLKDAENPVGFIPGEGASVFLLGESAIPQSKRFNLPCHIEVNLDRQSVDEEKLRDRWLGADLYSLMSSLVPNNGALESFPHIFTDVNGEEKRAVEFAQVNMSVKRDFGKAYKDDNYTIPALSFADTGSFSGAISFGLIAYLFLRPSFASKTPIIDKHFLILLSDTDGKRSVIKVDL